MHNPENERIKRAYFFYLKEARRLGEHSVDCAAAALAKFEDYTKFRDFKRFHIQQAIGFKRMLSDQISPRTGERLSRGTVFSALNALRGFFLWLATQPGYRSHLTPADAKYFSLSDKKARIAKAALDRPVPTIADPSCVEGYACRHRRRVIPELRAALEAGTVGARATWISSIGWSKEAIEGVTPMAVPALMQQVEFLFSFIGFNA